jgi:hypothetical protein
MKDRILSIIILILTNISMLKSDFTLIDKIDDSTNINNLAISLFVFHNDVYFLAKMTGYVALPYKFSDNQYFEPYKDILNSIKPDNNIKLLFMADTNYQALTYNYGDLGNEVLVKEKEKWNLYNHINSKLMDDVENWKVLFSNDGEIAIINSSNIISFVKDGEYSFKDCGNDFDCMVMPFWPDPGLYFEGCLFYLNSDYNYTRMCNKEIDRIFSYEEFQIPSKYKSQGTSYSIHKDKLYFSNHHTNKIYSLKGDEIGVFTPISAERLKDFAWDEGRPLLITSYIFGNDGYLYCLYKESVNGAPKGKAKLFKLTEDFELIDTLPLPNQVDDDYNAVFTLAKDMADTNNKKLYITASMGFYIYDPEPTSVINNNEIGNASLFISEIYPNPSGGLVNVRYGSDVSNSGKIKMFITNVMGQRIKEFDHNGSYNISTGYGTSILDVSDIATGSYQLVITDGNNYVSKNILVIR